MASFLAYIAFTASGTLIGIEPLSTLITLDRAVAGQNFAVGIGNFLTAATALYLLREYGGFRRLIFADSEARTEVMPWVLLGSAIFEISWGIHRLYWYTWRVIKELGYEGVGNKLENVFAWLTAAPMFGVMFGTAIAMSPALRRAFGRQWVYVVTGAYGLLYVIGYNSADFWHTFFGCGPDAPVWDNGNSRCIDK